MILFMPKTKIPFNLMTMTSFYITEDQACHHYLSQVTTALGYLFTYLHFQATVYAMKCATVQTEEQSYYFHLMHGPLQLITTHSMSLK